MEDWETEEGLAILKASSSLTMEKIAKQVIGLKNKSTLYQWCKKSPRIKAAVSQKLDEERRLKVEEAAYEACFDRKKKVKSFKQVLDRKGVVHDLREEKEVVIPADYGMQRYYLNNRDPERWSQKPTTDVGEGQTPIGFIPIFDRMESEEPTESCSEEDADE